MKKSLKRWKWKPILLIHMLLGKEEPMKTQNDLFDNIYRKIRISEISIVQT